MNEKAQRILEGKALSIRNTARKEYGLLIPMDQALRLARISLRAEHHISQRSKNRGTETCA